jgi:hypothetical protein
MRGETPPEDPAVLLREFEEMASELERLIASVNRTNLATKLGSGETLTNALARRDILALRQAVVRQVADVAGERQQRYGRAEIRILPTVDSASYAGRRTNFPASGASSTHQSRRRTGPQSCWSRASR